MMMIIIITILNLLLKFSSLSFKVYNNCLVKEHVAAWMYTYDDFIRQRMDCETEIDTVLIKTERVTLLNMQLIRTRLFVRTSAIRIYGENVIQSRVARGRHRQLRQRKMMDHQH